MHLHPKPPLCIGVALLSAECSQLLLQPLHPFSSDTAYSARVALCHVQLQISALQIRVW